MPTSPDEPTYLAWLTPPGAAALAVLALRGPHAWTVLQELFRPARTNSPPLPNASEQVALSGRFWLGWLGEAGGQADQVVVALKRGGPAPWAEVHCHGGREVARLIEGLLVARGITPLPWQDLEARTTGDANRAAAVAVLAEAPTVRTAGIALDQVQGAFDRAWAAVLQRQDVAEAGRLLDELARFAPVGRHLNAPWRVAVLGAPNVGKSSLINLLAGYQRSVVSPVAGTTRDVVTAAVAVDGWPVELLDTAGWRAGAEALEKQGIDLARATAAGADLCLWVLDAAAPTQWPEGDFAALRLVVNKIDLPAVWDLGQAAGAVRVSARTGAGLEELLTNLSHWLVPDPPPAGAVVPFTPALCDLVEQARRLKN
jgi:tRNA modification GTPase